MKVNRTARQLAKYEPKDPIFEAVVERMTRMGKGFFIIACGPWIHPVNKVMNCYAIQFDGFIQYKFELTEQGYKVAEIRVTEWLCLRLITGNTYTEKELVEIIKNS